MDVEAPRGLLGVLEELEDPRMEQSKLYRLSDLPVITLCAVIGGVDTWMEIELFGKAKLDWLRTFLDLPHGIPSHDTFGRVFSRLNPEQLERCFLTWKQALAQAGGRRLIAIDGKALRAASTRRITRPPFTGLAPGARPITSFWGHWPAARKTMKSRRFLDS